MFGKNASHCTVRPETEKKSSKDLTITAMDKQFIQILKDYQTTNYSENQ